MLGNTTSSWGMKISIDEEIDVSSVKLPSDEGEK
jgi:hypothetical protein